MLGLVEVHLVSLKSTFIIRIARNKIISALEFFFLVNFKGLQQKSTARVSQESRESPNVHCATRNALKDILRLSRGSLRRRLGARGRARRCGRGRVVRVIELPLEGRGRGARVGRGGTLPLALLLLHAPVLEPDLYLRLVQLQRGGDLHPTRSRQVLAEVELLLQFRQLPGAEVGADGVVGRAHEAKV